MKYMGSKNRHAKEILPIILKDRKPGQWYVEPFVGGFNVIDKVDGNRLASDYNIYVIALFKAIQEGWLPPENVSEQEYINAKNNPIIKPLTAFIGFGCSYSGKWFGGYARGNNDKSIPRNYCLESKTNILKQYTALQGVQIENYCYQDLPIPDNSIIYCDPPYRNTTKYKDTIDYDHFYQWCRDMSKQGHQVFISEYAMPDDFVCVWEKKVNSSLTKNTGGKKGIEKLFVAPK